MKLFECKGSSAVQKNLSAKHIEDRLYWKDFFMSLYWYCMSAVSKQVVIVLRSVLCGLQLYYI